MKTPALAIISAFAALTFAGCASHAAKFELRSLQPTNIEKLGGLVIREVGVTLGEFGFTRDPEARLIHILKNHHPDAVTWSKPPRAGEQEGGMSVWFWVSRGVIEIHIDAKGDGRGADFEATRLALLTRFEQRFPELQVRVQSWKYLNMKKGE